MTRWNTSTLVIDLVLACIINTTAMLVSAAPLSVLSWVPGTASAFCINVLLQLVLPVPAFAARITAPLKSAVVQHLAELFVVNACYVSCISLSMAYLATGGVNIFDFWWQSYITLLLVGYVATLGCDAAAQRLAHKHEE
ncbi:ABC transporter ATPase [Collinsella sp. zg1085]|uniref:ABC transporter ATPase n=1 Tax=Collinsella sp. zg1085 TaxID=2844380 RepID=UPI001C0D915A|nr:ABC transporter ATPase [Collinsella sp. zg1085]QWT17181.1 ABC transporter ATPase [Collinsella sp. zg1085]